MPGLQLRPVDGGSIDARVPPLYASIHPFGMGLRMGSMARKIDRLTDRTVKSKNERGLYADGSGLYLRIGKGGNKSWVFRFKQKREDGRLACAKKKSHDGLLLVGAGSLYLAPVGSRPTYAKSKSNGRQGSRRLSCLPDLRRSGHGAKPVALPDQALRPMRRAWRGHPIRRQQLLAKREGKWG
jgi:hypothetical protein